VHDRLEPKPDVLRILLVFFDFAATILFSRRKRAKVLGTDVSTLLIRTVQNSYAAVKVL
jgi:hypothetical protein